VTRRWATLRSYASPRDCYCHRTDEPNIVAADLE
jgi:hypothetical protein